MIKTVFHILLFFYLDYSECSKIQTIMTAKNLHQVTSGNEAVQRLNFQWLENDSRPFIANIKNLHNIQKNVNYYNDIKNTLIMDFPNEDTKYFSIQNSDYWYVASKRGFLFQLVAIMSIIFAFWVFTLRISYGKCGGYKTIIRKPSKRTRHQRIKIFIISSAFTVMALLGGLITSYLYAESSQKIGNSLILKNKYQFNQVNTRYPDSIKNRLVEINDRKLQMMYAEENNEVFRIAILIDDLLKEYEESEIRALNFNQYYFQTQKRIQLMKIFITLMCTSLIIMGFVNVYKKRKVLYSLGISVLLFLLMIFLLNTMASGFNDWSVAVELCQETIETYQMSTTELGVNQRENLDQILTCLSSEGKQSLKSQLVSVMIGQNTLLQIMNKFAIENNKLQEVSQNLFISKKTLLNNLDKVQNAFSTHPEMYTYMNTFMELNEIQNSLNDLAQCTQQKDWSRMVNKNMCQSGLNQQYYSLWFLLVALISMFTMAAGIYLTENVIRGIYNEEIQYVKTNKQRYDWN